MRMVVSVMSMLLIVIGTPAQEPEKPAVSFETLQLKAGVLTGNYKSKQMVRHLGGGVKLVFVAKDPVDNMTVEAVTIDFRYDEAKVDESSEAGDNTPSTMELNGDIVIKSQGMLIKSQKAIIDLRSMEADFIGYTEIFSEGNESPAQAERFTINFETGEFVMKEAFVPSFDLMPQKDDEESSEKP